MKPRHCARPRCLPYKANTGQHLNKPALHSPRCLGHDQTKSIRITYEHFQGQSFLQKYCIHLPFGPTLLGTQSFAEKNTRLIARELVSTYYRMISEAAGELRGLNRGSFLKKPTNQPTFWCLSTASNSEFQFFSRVFKALQNLNPGYLLISFLNGPPPHLTHQMHLFCSPR